MSYLKGTLSSKKTPQTRAIPGREADMVPNSAGGVVFGVDCWTRLQRFLILGSEGGSYYATQQKLTLENAKAAQECVKADGLRTVQIVTEVSDQARAPKNDQAIFVLAIAASYGDDPTRAAALSALPKVCRIGTHLFQFCEHVDGMRGWGRGLRRAVANWYTERSDNSLALQLIKYQQRDGWSHRDVLRLAHPITESKSKDAAMRWSVGGDLGTRTVSRKKGVKCGSELSTGAVMYEDLSQHLPDMIRGFELIKRVPTEKDVITVLKEFRLPHECIPTQYKTSPAVWEALLPEMGLTAMLRNLANMTRYGVLGPMSDATKFVVNKLTDPAGLAASRIHPIAVLTAMKTYESGRSLKGDNVWSPVRQIVDGLDKAFYLAFKNVEPTGKRWMLALDVSGSMTGGMCGGVQGLSPRVGSVAMALVTANVEDQYMITGFTAGSRGYYARNRATADEIDGISELKVSPRQRLTDACNEVNNLAFGSTDCSLPMRYALAKKIPFDVFVVYTDSETYAGPVQPVQALRAYREKMGIDAKLIVCGMVSNGFTIADPKDRGMIDCVGFDASTPNIMGQFALGNI
jgi:60 kDa SS-A/Ro ribonucleoprotein